MAADTLMVTVQQAREKVRQYYERHYRAWASQAFWNAGNLPKGALPPKECLSRGKAFSLRLHPPTEQQALASIATARSWAQAWRESSLAPFVEWAAKEWRSIGRQEIPQRFVLTAVEDIVACAAKKKEWNLVYRRTMCLAAKWHHTWKQLCPPVAEDTFDAFDAVIKKTVAGYGGLDESNWERYLLVMDWLVKNSARKCYVRQLPIRGVDTKWLEAHRSLIEPLFAAMTAAGGLDFLAVPAQIRIRFLDKSLAPQGLVDLSVVPGQMAAFIPRPQKVIICENLVTVLALPEIAQTMAIHGGGYAVSRLAELDWLGHMPLWYWGDLDSNGFAILNRLRHHFPHVVSLMMDISTLKAHRDLCVHEASPNLGKLDKLTVLEQQTLDALLSGSRALRLEQERIEWNYALSCISEALENTVGSCCTEV